MTRAIQTLAAVAGSYHAIVLDQWGVLHDGSTPYPGAVEALRRLRAAGHRLAVLSNSGKRAAPNAERIAAMGFPPALFEVVMTSGEALYRDIAEGRVTARRFLAVERAPGDAAAWGAELEITLTDAASAEAILLMGLPDGSTLDQWQPLLDGALARGLPVYCSNPDRQSPRAGGLVISPGALAFAYRAMGGEVAFYGKPHRPVFDAVAEALGTTNMLMVGDSLEHDIAGAAAAGWDSLLVEGGLYAADFARGDGDAVLAELVAAKGTPAPTYRIEALL
ncbi:MAG: TIGR01459 family HAD-type hydrolase [Pseudomonadota bacterium]